MPIYEYKCRKCGEQFEAFQGITDPELKSCQFCKGKVDKLVSMSSFTLKGSGWYTTDYGGKKSKSAAASAPSKDESSKAENYLNTVNQQQDAVINGKKN